METVDLDQAGPRPDPITHPTVLLISERERPREREINGGGADDHRSCSSGEGGGKVNGDPLLLQIPSQAHHTQKGLIFTIHKLLLMVTVLSISPSAILNFAGWLLLQD